MSCISQAGSGGWRQQETCRAESQDLDAAVVVLLTQSGVAFPEGNVCHCSPALQAGERARFVCIASVALNRLPSFELDSLCLSGRSHAVSREGWYLLPDLAGLLQG